MEAAGLPGLPGGVAACDGFYAAFAGSGAGSKGMDRRFSEEFVGQERCAADKHDQAEGPHAQAGADADVQDNGKRQHERAPALLPDENREGDLP